MPLGVAFVQETTVFREFGPLAGSTMRLAYEVAPKIGNTLSRQTIDVDARYYQRLGAHGPAGAARSAASRAWGDAPDFIYFGGNSELRGYDYLQFVGQNGVLRERRAALPADRGDADADRRPRRHPRRVLRQHRRRPRSEGHDVQVVRRPTPSRTRRSSAIDVNPIDRRSRRPIYGRPDQIVTGSACRTRARRTASASRPSRSASRSTSTGRGRRCSTRTGKTRCSRRTAAATSSASRSSRSGSATTSRG